MTYYCVRCSQPEASCECSGKLFFSLKHHSFLETLSEDQRQELESDVEDEVGMDTDEEPAKVVLDLEHATEAGIPILGTDLVLGEGSIGPALAASYKAFKN